MTFRVGFAPEALSDLYDLYLFVSDRADDMTANRYIERIKGFCEMLRDFPDAARHETIFLQVCALLASRSGRVSWFTSKQIWS